MTTINTISRRDFLKSASVLASTAAAVSVLPKVEPFKAARDSERRAEG